MERYALYAPKELIEQHFGVHSKSDSLFDPSYNVFTGSPVPVIYGDQEIGRGKWSGATNKDAILNDSDLKKQMEQRPCILPVSGFYMWKQNVKDPMPFFVRMLNREVLGIAGYMTEDKDQRVFNVVTMPANVLLQPLDETMPCILEPQMYEGWLSGKATEILNKHFKSTALMPELAVYRVADLVNDPKENRPELIQPIPKRRDDD